MDYCSQISSLDKYTQKRDPFSTELLNAVKTKTKQRRKKHIISRKGDRVLIFYFCELRYKDISIFTLNL